MRPTPCPPYPEPHNFWSRLSPLERRLLSCWTDDDRRCTKQQETSCGEHAENVDGSLRVAVVHLADFGVPNAVPVRDRQCSDKEDVSEHYGDVADETVPSSTTASIGSSM